jgi:cellulose synthase/poly-beta-1,6-N-acetylglucosamine synthase-like glycosyltransferase
VNGIIIALLALPLWVVWAALALAVGYLLMLTLAAAAPRRAVPPATGYKRFRIVIPAHDEALVLEAALRRLFAVDYPREAFDVLVVADNCADDTAAVARACGARVLERCDPIARGKGHALAYAFATLRGEAFDAYVILDADTLVEPGLPRTMNDYLHAGHRIMQAHYDVLDPFASQRTTIMYIAFRIFNYVRPLGRRALGFSTGLQGNGMCFAKPVIDQYAWKAFSLAEDIEYTTTLLLHGERVVFAPEARVSAQMPAARAQATSQRMRWEAGRLQLARRDGPRLLVQGLRRFDRRIFDWGVDLLIPPLAGLTLAIGAGTLCASLLALALPAPATTFLVAAWAGLAGALVLFVLGAMVVGRVSWQAYGALLNAPWYVAWKLWIYVLMLVRRTPQTWVRTDRTRILDR